MTAEPIDVGADALKLLTVEQVADRLECSPKTVRRLIYAWRRNHNTGLESVHVGASVRIAPEAVIEYKNRLRAEAQQRPAA